MKESLKYGCGWAMIPVLGFLASSLYNDGALTLFDAVFLIFAYPIFVWLGTHVYRRLYPASDETLPVDGKSNANVGVGRADFAPDAWWKLVLVCVVGLALMIWVYANRDALMERVLTAITVQSSLSR
jgi:hypothetical protein